MTRQVRGKDAQGNDAIKSKSFEPAETKKPGGRAESRAKFEQEAIDKGYTRGSADFDRYVKTRMRQSDLRSAREIGREIGKVLTQTFATPLFIGTNKASGETKYAGEKLQQQQLKATTAQTEATKKQSDKIEKLIETMESFIKSAGGGGGTP